MCAAMSAATTRAAASAKIPALATVRLPLATSPSAYTPGKRVARFLWSTGIQPSGASPKRVTTSGARWRGIPMNRSYGTLPPPASQAVRARASRPTTSSLGAYWIPRSSSALRNSCETSWVTGTGRRHREGHPNVHGVPHSPLHQQIVQQERSLERGRRAFERMAQDRDQDPPPREVGEGVAQALGAGERVVLKPALPEPGRGRKVVLRSQRHREVIRVIAALLGDTRAASADRSPSPSPDGTRRPLWRCRGSATAHRSALAARATRPTSRNRSRTRRFYRAA